MAVVCPQCRTPVPWKRRMFGAHIWAKWRCANCNALLKFKALRRVPIVLGLYPLAFCVYLFTRRYLTSLFPSEVLVVVLAIVFTPLMMAMEGVTIIEYGHGYCRDCGYNLMGLTSNRCPECGRMVEPEERVEGDEDEH